MYFLTNCKNFIYTHFSNIYSFHHCLDPLKRLEFGEYFNVPFEVEILPEGLISLTFPSKSMYNQRFKPGALPSTLEELTLCPKYWKGFCPGALPSGLKILYAQE
jgi:hypothetical protein